MKVQIKEENGNIQVLVNKHGNTWTQLPDMNIEELSMLSDKIYDYLEENYPVTYTDDEDCYHGTCEGY